MPSQRISASTRVRPIISRAVVGVSVGCTRRTYGALLPFGVDGHRPHRSMIHLLRTGIVSCWIQLLQTWCSGSKSVNSLVLFGHESHSLCVRVFRGHREVTSPLCTSCVASAPTDGQFNRGTIQMREIERTVNSSFVFALPCNPLQRTPTALPEQSDLAPHAQETYL